MDIDALTDDDLDQLASQLAGRLPTGRYGRQFVLSRRQLLSLAGGSAGVAGLVALGVDPATAQSAAGQVGTASSPETVYAYDLNVQGALQRDLDAGEQAIENAGSVSTDEATINEQTVRVYQTAGQTVSTDTTTKVQFDTEDSAYNPGDVLTADLSNNQILIDKPGRYIVSGQASISNPPTDTSVFCFVSVDGSVEGQQLTTYLSGGNAPVGATAIVSVSSTPTPVTCEIFHNAGSDRNIQALEDHTRLDVGRLG